MFPPAALGWVLTLSIVQAAIVAAGLRVILKALPDRPRLRQAAGIAATLTLVAAVVGTTVRIGADWEEHDACWRDAMSGTITHACHGHGVSVLNRTEAENKAAASRTAALPGPRRIALRWTDFAGAIAGLWGAVALALLALDWRARRRLARVVRTSLPVRDPGVVEAFDRLRADMGVRRPVRLRTSNAVSSPCLIGWRSPAILLPPHVIAVLDRRQLRGILAHELSHVLHHDGLASSLQRGIEIVLALNPFVRWISNCIRESGEAECDRIGATVGARSSRAYVEALLVLEGYRSASLPRGPALALLGSGSLSARVRRLAERPVRAGRGRRTRLTGTLMLALATGLLVSVVIETTHRGEALGSWAVMSDDIDHRLAAPRSVAPEPPTTP